VLKSAFVIAVMVTEAVVAANLVALIWLIQLGSGLLTKEEKLPNVHKFRVARLNS